MRDQKDKEYVILVSQAVEQIVDHEAIRWTGIEQHRTFFCIKCGCTTRLISYEKTPEVESLHRCKGCGFSMREARQIGRLKKVVVLLNEAKELLQVGIKE